MEPIAAIADQFFAACEAGKGWAACKNFCVPTATFACQAEPLADITTLEQYCNWMTGLLQILPDGRYDIISFATDATRGNVTAYAVFHGTHTGPGGPVPPTGRKVASDYVYVMQFEGGKIRHMTKIWHAGLAMKALGWA